jgi:hypothetical protein
VVSGAFRHQQHKNEIDRLPIRRVKRDRGLRLDESGNRFAQVLDASMRDGHALPQAGGAELLAGKQAVKNLAAGNLPVVLEQYSDPFEYSLLAALLGVQNDILNRQDLTNQVHR